MTGIQKAVAAYQAGHLAVALDEAQKALTFATESERTALNVLLSNIHLKLGNRKQAADSFVLAARDLPDKSAAFFKFAIGLYRDEGQFDAIADIASEAARALADPDFLYELATACKACGRLPEAAGFIADLDFGKSPHFIMLTEFGTALNDAGRFNRFLADACKSRPENVMLLSLRFAVARSVCDFAALEEFDRLIADSNTPLARGLLENELAHRRLLRSSDEALQLLPSYDERALEIAGGTVPAKRRAFSPDGARITIGYLSNDFCQHVTMRLFEEVMLLHDRTRFDIRLFSYTQDDKLAYQQNWPQELRSATVQVGHLSDAEAANAIDAAAVDILVDLKGYTQGARLGIIRQSTVPVKVTYIGYPGSVRGADIDYTISDHFVAPDSSKPFYEEKFCRLPESYQANGSHSRPLPEKLTRAELGLPEGKVVLGSFNAPNKMAPEVIRVWADILNRLPGAVLNMLCSEAAARDNIRAAFADAGADLDRIVFFAGEAYRKFLARIEAVDIALDSFPCNGHTTSSDILWVGTPMVARKGSHFAGRVSESLLNAMGMPELIASNNDAYCDLVVNLAENPERRAGIRQQLQQNRTRMPLFDTERFTRHLERAYEMMAARSRQGLPPDHLDVEALPVRTAPFEI